MAAALNGVLAQIVMASRVLFGLGKRSPWLAVFRSAHPRFGTPVLASVLVGLSVVLAAMTLPVAVLAEVTSQALLIVFALVNAALIALDRREPARGFDAAHWVPWLGLIACIAAFAGSFWS